VTDWAGALDRRPTVARPLWRRYSDRINGALVRRWLPHEPSGRVLKTDLFDEATGAGLYPRLAERFAGIAGIDVDGRIVEAAAARYPDLEAVLADVRALPFGDGAFAAVVSSSTLDHFPARDDIAGALTELRRVLEPGGRLLITLDNLANPAVALRNALPYPLLRRLGLVPYFVGASHGPRGLRDALGGAGFEVRELTATQHSPRAAAVALARALEGRSAVAQQRLLDLLAACERLDRLPTRFLTGCYVAAVAVRR